MDLDEEPLESVPGLDHSLLAWVGTFGEGGAPRLEELGDGVVLYRLLGALEPAYFDVEQAGIKTETDGTFLLALNNLRKLVASLQRFCADRNVFDRPDGAPPVELDFIDVSAVASSQDHAEIVKLLEVVLLASVHTEGKEQAVSHIFGLDESMQQQLMFVLKEMSSRFSAAGGGSAASAAPAEEDPATKEQLESLQKKYRELHTYARKAKEQLVKRNDVIEQLRKQNEQLKGMSGTSEAVAALRQQVRDLMGEVEMQKKMRLEYKDVTRRELQLMSSAFYELGQEFQLHVAGGPQAPRGAASGATPHRNSWLNRQRERLRGTPGRRK